MNLHVFLEAPVATQIHIIAALAAAALGSFVLWRRKGGRLHKLSGRFWAGLMAVTAASSFFIHDLRVWGDYSPIHLLSVLVLFYSLPMAVVYARRRNITAHKQIMQTTFMGGIVVAGAFTLLPGRMMHEILFGAPDFSVPQTGWYLSISAAVAIAGYFWVSGRLLKDG